MTKKELNVLSTRARDMFILSTNVRANKHVYMLKDQIRKIETELCGVFQLYFYENLFDFKSNSATLSHEILNKRTVKNSVK